MRSTLFDEQAPDTVRLGRLAFEALWAASSLVPERRLTGPLTARPSGAYERDRSAGHAAPPKPARLAARPPLSSP